MSDWIEATLGIETKHYALCPSCGKGRHFYGHLIDRFHDGFSFGPWACDECGFFADFRCVGLEESDLRIKPSTTRAPLVRKYVLLQRGELRLVVETEIATDWDEDNEAYLFDSHTCPTNYIGDVVAILLGTGEDCDSDPHGVFEYVCSVEKPAEFDDLNVDGVEWLKLFGITE
jgi:hypothetical protein